MSPQIEGDNLIPGDREIGLLIDQLDATSIKDIIDLYNTLLTDASTVVIEQQTILAACRPKGTRHDLGPGRSVATHLPIGRNIAIAIDAVISSTACPLIIEK